MKTKIKTIIDNKTGEKYLCLNDMLDNLTELQNADNMERIEELVIESMIDILKVYSK